MSSGLVLRTASMALVAVALTACADTRDQSLCDQAADLRASVQQLADLEPETADVADVRAAVDEIRLHAQQLSAAADGSVRQSASDLQTALGDLRSSLVAIDDEGTEAARPLIEEAWQAVLTTHAELEELLDVDCTATE